VPTKKHSVKQIAKLCEMEKLTARETSIPTAGERSDSPIRPFYRWRTGYDSMKEDEARRLQIHEHQVLCDGSHLVPPRYCEATSLPPLQAHDAGLRQPFKGT
jgi:hypothetical protein